MENNAWEILCRETAARVEAVRDRIGNAARRSGRDADAVRLIAVTKYATGHEGFEAALQVAGCFDFGENRPQRLLDKTRYFAESREQNAETSKFPPPESIRWHFIGSLQRNKVRRVLPHVAMIHSVDTPELFEAIDRIMWEETEKSQETATESFLPERIPILLEVNISGEGNKHGFQPDDLLDRAGFIFDRPGKTILCGLMGMGGLESTPSEVRNQFAILRHLFEKVRDAFPALTDFTEISMGMSGDFETAIEEGATMVRIGSILYPDRF